MSIELLGRKLTFGDNAQINELKRQRESVEWCAKCNQRANDCWDEGCGDFFECENCKLVWWYEGKKKIVETF